jgi:DNA-directed RNA polymerase specialized sigma subunit
MSNAMDSLALSARDKLVLDNLKLAPYMVHRFPNIGMVPQYYQDELHSEARLALVIAAANYDPSRYEKFSTYACVVIKNRLINFGRKTFLTENKPLHMPKLGKVGTDYNRILKNREQKRRYRAEHEDVSVSIDVAAFRRGIYARSGILF